MKVERLGDTKEHFRCLIYGRIGTRKTTFAATCPKPLFLDYERSTDSLRHQDKNDISIIRPKSIKQLLEIIKELPGEFETVVIDSVSRFQMQYMREHMKEAVAKSSSRDINTPLFADYRKTGAVLDEVFDNLHHIEMNVILIAHERIILDEETKRVVAIRPSLTPALADAVSGLINCVAYSELKQVGTTTKHILHFNSGGKYLAKNRLHILNDVEDPTYDKVFLNGSR